MKTTFFTLAAALAVREVAAHATFQDLWVNGVDQGQQCVRLPQSNSPLQDVTSNNIRCNANIGAVSGRCAVAAGDTVSIEMHQQGGDRGCGSEAIGGAHYGPVHAYLSKVSDARTADGSSGFFKIFANTWAPAKNGAADNDYWGTKELNNCCGKMDVTIPSDIPAGDYLLRAEVIALHVASGLNGAQFYVSCYQITVSGGGSASPATVTFPGAYKNTDPGIYIDIHNSISTYIDPGPTVYAGGVSRAPLASGCTGYAAKETPTKSVVQPTIYTPGQDVHDDDDREDIHAPADNAENYDDDVQGCYDQRWWWIMLRGQVCSVWRDWLDRLHDLRFWIYLHRQRVLLPVFTFLVESVAPLGDFK
ncbi:hypothetical protein B0A48_00054 [Cryoendolithus antarcticus]|uniref:AA9 family lytic polysaccharide monooxygenase n=1 Tax=Cryoendolithus antarcticus TaxID=1507870 RepID=A0A1V8TTK8_9PEZI|nr:hypothetical protein B0A48_00054 [Cryoendolithus antarcticus]